MLGSDVFGKIGLQYSEIFGGRVPFKLLYLLVLSVVLSLSLTACDGRIGLEDIGGECSSYTDCGGIESRAACITEWPEGYCTELSCTLGSCPLGSRCVTGISFANVSIDAFCLATCESNEDCREAYMCTDVGQTERTCAPR